MSTVPAEDRVRAAAYALWLAEGMPEGRAEAHWFKALELVNTEAGEAPFETAIAGEKVAAKPKRKAPAAAAKKSAPRKRG